MRTFTYALIFVVTFSNTICGQETKSYNSGLTSGTKQRIDSLDFAIDSFSSFPEDYAFNKAMLMDKIKPSMKYAYWECLCYDSSIDKVRGTVTVYNGDSLHFAILTKKLNCTKGFFNEGHLINSFSYIIGVQPNKTIDLIDTNEKLKKFIGHIDNKEEALLIAKINGYWFDHDTIIGGSYKERPNDYLLYLLDYSSTPVTYKSVKAILTKKGDFQLIDKIIYKQSNEYIIE